MALGAGFELLLGDGLEIGDDGLFTITVQDPVFVDSSGVGLNYGTGLTLSGTDLVLDILGLTTDTIAAGDWVPFHDLTDGPNKITFANFEGTISHDGIADVDANEHIDWTNASENLLTTGTITSNGNAMRADRIGLGIAASVASAIKVQKIYSDTSGTKFGMDFKCYGNPTQDSTMTINAVAAYPLTTSLGWNLSNLIGFYTQPQIRHTAGAFVNVRAIYVAGSLNANSAGAVGSWYGIFIDNPSKSGSSTETVGVQAGIWMTDQTRGAVNYGVVIASDIIGLTLGIGQDMLVHYDGVDGNIDTSLIAPSDLEITCGAQKTLELQNTVWKDVNMGAGTLSGPPGLQPGTANYVDEVGADTGIATVGIAVGEGLSGNFEMQHDYKEGSNIVFHVHWQGIAVPAGTDNVKWQLTYTIGKQGGTTLDAVTTITVETGIAARYGFYRSNFAAIVGTDIDVEDQFLFTIQRVAASANEYGGEALLATVGIHYEVDTLGSRQIDAK